MRKRICNKVLWNSCPLVLFWGGGGKGIGKLPVSHAFSGVGKVPVSHTKNWAICTSPLRTKRWSDSQLHTGNIFPWKVTVIEGLLMFFFSCRCEKWRKIYKGKLFEKKNLDAGLLKAKNTINSPNNSTAWLCKITLFKLEALLSLFTTKRELKQASVVQ